MALQGLRTKRARLEIDIQGDVESSSNSITMSRTVANSNKSCRAVLIFTFCNGIDLAKK